MKILDRYIVFSFIRKLLWSLLAATIIFLVVDVVEHIDNFVDYKVSFAVAFRYYYLFIPYIMYLIFPVAALLATLFTIGGLTMTNELAAIKVSGVPFSRPLTLLIITTALGAFGIYVLGETVIPNTNHIREDLYRYEIKRLPRENRAELGRIYVQLGSEKQLYINDYKSTTREAYGIQIIETSAGRILKRIDAAKMVWRDGLWLLVGAVERDFNSDGSLTRCVEVVDSVSGEGVRPDEFERIRTLPEELNRQELLEFVERLKQTGGKTLKWETEASAKTAQPVAAVIIVLFGAPIASIKRRGGTALGFAISLLICFIYFGAIQIGKVLGYNGTLDPWLAAWIGNLLFGLVGLALLAKTVR